MRRPCPSPSCPLSLLLAGASDDAPAQASYTQASHHKSGFGVFKVTTNPQFSDELQMSAAGFLEGYLTAEQIYDHYYNIKSYYQTYINDTFKVGRW